MQPDQPADALEFQAVVGAHPSVVADFLKPGRENVLEKRPHELLSPGLPRDPLARPGRLDPKADGLFGDLLDPVVADGDPVDIGSQVLENGGSVAHGLEVHDPVLLEDPPGELVIQPGLPDGLDEQSFVQLFGRERMKQPVGPGLDPPLPVGGDAPGGNDEVDMGMIDAQVASPGVQHAEEAGLAAAQEAAIGQENRGSSGCPPGRGRCSRRGWARTNSLSSWGTVKVTTKCGTGSSRRV